MGSDITAHQAGSRTGAAKPLLGRAAAMEAPAAAAPMACGRFPKLLRVFRAPAGTGGPDGLSATPGAEVTKAEKSSSRLGWNCLRNSLEAFSARKTRSSFAWCVRVSAAQEAGYAKRKCS
mmetsp:Transcript_13541/g.37115  ORF Transcript_13541/g.37115 Transcript_13541/m.37115 type:complete len:120 (-) Transcript_13541:19-378(-)